MILSNNNQAPNSNNQISSNTQIPITKQWFGYWLLGHSVLFGVCNLVIGYSFLLSSCGPTYPKDQVLSSLKKLCKEEYGLDISAQIVGKTLGVYLPLEKLLDSTLQIPKEAREKLDDVILATSRVVLSTDRPLDFYVVVAQDQRVLGTELRLTRYIPDVKRFSYGELPHHEFSQRILFDVGLGVGTPDDGSASFLLEEVTLNDFLALQIARRLDTKFKEEEALKERFDLRASHGRFSPYRPETSEWGMSKGHYGDFIFSLDVRSRGLGLITMLGEEDLKEVLQVTLTIIPAVLKSYRFEAFDAVEIHLVGVERPLILDRDLLELYRRKKIDLNELLTPTHFDLPAQNPQPLFNQ